MVPTAWQDEALARDGVSREVPCSALKGETVPDSLPATPNALKAVWFEVGPKEKLKVNQSQKVGEIIPGYQNLLQPTENMARANHWRLAPP